MQSPALRPWEQRHREQTVAAMEGRCHRAVLPMRLGGCQGWSLVPQLHSQPGPGAAGTPGLMGCLLQGRLGRRVRRVPRLEEEAVGRSPEAAGDLVSAPVGLAEGGRNPG